MRIRSYLIIALLTGTAGALLPAESLRIGDPTSVEVSQTDRDYYPLAPVWAAAGVPGGIPAIDQLAVSVPAGGDIQATIDAHESGVILLAAARYELTSPLRIADKQGLVLRGATDGTTLTFTGPALTITGSAVGIEGIDFVHADPEALLQAGHLRSGVYRDAPGFDGEPTPTISLADCHGSWLSDVAVRQAVSDPLHLVGSKACTLRNLHLDGTLNRGTNHGLLRIHDCEDLLVTGLRVDGLRGIRLVGPLRHSVFTGAALGAGFQLREGRSLQGLLFEDCHFLLPPGSFWKPFSKGPDPLGPESVMINCSAYHHGTDAVVGGVLMEPGEPYVIQPTSSRGRFDPRRRQYEPARLVERMQLARPHPEERNTQPAVAIDNPTIEVPDHAAFIAASNQHLLHRFLSSGPIPMELAEGDLVELNRQPLGAGQTRSLGPDSTPVTFTALPDEVKHFPPPLDPMHVAKMQAKFGVRPTQPTGASIDLLAAVGGSWNKGIILQSILRLQEPVRLRFDRDGTTGCRLRFWAGESLIEDGRTYDLPAGDIPLLLAIRVFRPGPFIRQSRLSLQMELVDDGEEKQIWVDTPKPTGGRLYPTTATVDPLAGERAGIRAWFDFFTAHRGEPYPGLQGDLQAIIDQHPDSLAARHVAEVLAIIAAAPHDETAGDLSAEAWGELADYYERAGLPERKWGIGKTKNPAKIRTYYPDVELPE